MLPLLIFAGPRALPTTIAASIYYAGGGISATIVRPRDCARHDDRFAPSSRFIDDEALVGVSEVRDYLVSNAGALLRFNRTPGWFLQQYIKLAAVNASDSEMVFVADGDTVFSNKLLTKLLKNPTILKTGEKFGNYDLLLDKMGLKAPSSSCVANGNIFSKNSIIRNLGSPTGFRSILNDYVIPSAGKLDFSEYQVTGSLLEPELGSRRIRMFRRFDLLVEDISDVPLSLVERALCRYDAIAIEANHHRSLIKRLAARAFYATGRSW